MSRPESPTHAVAEDLAPILADLGLAPGELHVLAPGAEAAAGAPSPGSALFGPVPGGAPIQQAAREIVQRCEPLLAADGHLLVVLNGAPAAEELARWRNALWPVVHVVALYHVHDGRAERELLQGRETLAGACVGACTTLVGVRREHALSPSWTVAKFDQNASGWNGVPGTPGYAHFRWMRRFMGRRAPLHPGERVLDFGCGAGWVGIEAALAAPGCELCAFDPSPEMVRLAEQNAREAGVRRFTGRVGFGEDPPFPAAGEAPFELVISSGVASFAPDLERWLDGLARTVAPGGALVVGDIDAASRGMGRRRRTRPLLPVREMNALRREDVAAGLAARGFVLEQASGYQLTRPWPQALHWADTRLSGVVGRAVAGALLAANRAAAGLDGFLEGRLEGAFDSWVTRLRAPPT